MNISPFWLNCLFAYRIDEENGKAMFTADSFAFSVPFTVFDIFVSRVYEYNLEVRIECYPDSNEISLDLWHNHANESLVNKRKQSLKRILVCYSEFTEELNRLASEASEVWAIEV